MLWQTRKQSLVWGLLLVLFGVLALVEAYIDLSVWAWVVILVAAGAIAFGVYLLDRSEWGSLITAYVLWAVAGLAALTESDVLADELIATYVLAAIALPFLLVFVRDRDQWWALIPAYVLLAIGVMVGLIGIGVLNELVIPAYVMFAIAIPFIGVYVRNPKEWWPLIPGGIMAGIGLAFLVAEAEFQVIGPVVLVLAGLWILVRQLTHRQPTTPDAPAVTDPQADEPPAE